MSRLKWVTLRFSQDIKYSWWDYKIMVRFVLRKLILQTHMRSHPVGLDVWISVGPFVYFHTSCVRTAKALARLRGCAGSPEPSLFAYVISTIIAWAGSFFAADLKTNTHGAVVVGALQSPILAICVAGVLHLAWLYSQLRRERGEIIV